MKFWDTSAIVALFVEEAASRGCRDVRRADPGIAVWLLTRTEVISAIRRRERLGELDAAEAEDKTRGVAILAPSWREISEASTVRAEAERLLAAHALRAADACQLGAALLWAEHRPRGRAFVTLDDGLAAAARAEGFDVIVPSAKRPRAPRKPTKKTKRKA